MPNLKSFDAQGVQFAWDATSLSNYMKCPRYYQWTNLEGWQPDSKSVHLLFGGWYATALEHFYKLIANGESKLSALHLVTREALEATWNVEDEPGPWISGHNTKTRGNLIRTIVWYIDRYELSPEADPMTVTHLANGDPAVELSFSLDFGDDILWCGHLDRVAETPEGMYIVDQKTTGGALSAHYFRQFLTDIQMSGYTFAGKILYNLPVKGVVIDAAQIAVGFTRFGRGFAPRSQAQLNEFYEVAHEYIAEAQQATRENHFRPNYASCNNYGGCTFRDICARSSEHRENFLRGSFTQRPRWDPLEKR